MDLYAGEDSIITRIPSFLTNGVYFVLGEVNRTGKQGKNLPRSGTPLAPLRKCLNDRREPLTSYGFHTRLPYGHKEFSVKVFRQGSVCLLPRAPTVKFIFFYGHANRTVLGMHVVPDMAHSVTSLYLFGLPNHQRQVIDRPTAAIFRMGTASLSIEADSSDILSRD